MAATKADAEIGVKVPVHVIPPVLGEAVAVDLTGGDTFAVEDALAEETLTDVTSVEVGLRVEDLGAASLEMHCE